MNIIDKINLYRQKLEEAQAVMAGVDDEELEKEVLRYVSELIPDDCYIKFGMTAPNNNDGDPSGFSLDDQVSYLQGSMMDLLDEEKGELYEIAELDFVGTHYAPGKTWPEDHQYFIDRGMAGKQMEPITPDWVRVVDARYKSIPKEVWETVSGGGGVCFTLSNSEAYRDEEYGCY